MYTEKGFGANGGHLELLTITLDISINEVFKDLIYLTSYDLKKKIGHRAMLFFSVLFQF